MSSREPISELNQRARVPPGCLVARRGRWTAHSRIVSRQPSSHRIDGTSARRLVLPRKIGKRALLRRNWLQWRPPAPGPMGWDRRRHADAFERPEFHLVSRSLLIRAPDTSAGTSDKPAKKSSSDRFFRYVDASGSHPDARSLGAVGGPPALEWLHIRRLADPFDGIPHDGSQNPQTRASASKLAAVAPPAPGPMGWDRRRQNPVASALTVHQQTSKMRVSTVSDFAA